MPLVHRIAAMLGLRGYHPLRLRRQGELWLVEVDGQRIAVPAKQRQRDGSTAMTFGRRDDS